jgi:hypothetical protein
MPETGKTMSETEQLLLKGTQLHERICALSSYMEMESRQQTKLLISFDLYCVMMEYSALLARFDSTGGETLEDLLDYEDLVFDTGHTSLNVSIDFFASPNTISIS